MTTLGAAAALWHTSGLLLEKHLYAHKIDHMIFLHIDLNTLHKYLT